MATTYKTKYTHKFRPSDRDVGPDIKLGAEDLTSPAKLAAALRKGHVLGTGGRIRQFRTEAGGKIVAFPSMPGMTTYWHAITLEPK